MIILLYGNDSFRSLKKLREIVGGYQKARALAPDLKYFDFSTDSFERFYDQFQTGSIFAQKKLFVLKNAFSNQDFKGKFRKSGRKFIASKHLIVFYEKKKLLKKDSFFVFLQKNGRWQDFETLAPAALADWLKQEFSRRRAEATPAGAALLISFVGNDLWRLSNEVEKLAILRLNAGKITPEDVRLMVKAKLEPQIFRTIELIAKKQRSLAVNLLHQHLAAGDSPLYLLSMIAFQFRKLLIVSDRLSRGLSPWELNWRPFLIKKTAQLARQFTFEELKDIYRQIIRTDAEIKNGKIDAGLALDLIIAKI
jgi:DNA polymerase-3 subunit delta